MAERIELIIGARDATGRAFSSVNKRVTKLTRRIGGFLRKATPVGGLLTGAGVLAVAKRAVDSAERQANVVRELSSALGPGSEALVSSLVAQADALQVVTGRSNDAIIASQALLANFGAAPDKIDSATVAVLDLAASFNQELEQSARNIGRTFGGLTGELGETLTELAGLTKAELQAGKAIEIVASLFGGRAQTSLSAFSLSIANVSNALDDLLKRLGRNVIQSETFVAALIGIREQLERTFVDPKKIEEAQEQFDGFVISIVKGAASTIDSSLTVGKTVIGFASEVSRGFRSLPEPVQQIGLFGAAFFGLKGVAGVSAISFVLGKFETDIRDLTENSLLLKQAISAGVFSLEDLLRSPEEAKAQAKAFVDANVAAADRILKKFNETGKELSRVDKSAIGERIRDAEEILAGRFQIEKQILDFRLRVNALARQGDGEGNVRPDIPGLPSEDAIRSRIARLKRILESNLRGIVSEALKGAQSTPVTPVSDFAEKALADLDRLRKEAARLLAGDDAPGGGNAGGDPTGDRAAREAAQREVELRRQLAVEMLSVEQQAVAGRLVTIQNEMERRLEAVRGNAELEGQIRLAAGKKIAAALRGETGGDSTDDRAARDAGLREIRLRRQIGIDLLDEERQGIAARAAVIQEEFEDRLIALRGNSEAQIAAVRARNNKMKELAADAQKSQGGFVRLLQTTGIDAARSFGDQFANVFSDFILGAESAGAAFKKFAADFLSQITRMIVQALVLLAIQQLLRGVTGNQKLTIPGALQLNATSQASGGIATRPTLAIVGDNPSQKEAIIPLDDPRATALLGGGGGGPQFSFSTQVVFEGGAVQTDVTGTGRREAAERAARQFNNMAQAWAIDNMRPGGIFSGVSRG